MVYFAQIELDAWIARCGPHVVARIDEVVEDKRYRITYRRQPSANPRNPATTTRWASTLDEAQDRIQRRGWR